MVKKMCPSVWESLSGAVVQWGFKLEGHAGDHVAPVREGREERWSNTWSP